MKFVPEILFFDQTHAPDLPLLKTMHLAELKEQFARSEHGACSEPVLSIVQERARLFAQAGMIDHSIALMQKQQDIMCKLATKNLFGIAMCMTNRANALATSGHSCKALGLLRLSGLLTKHYLNGEDQMTMRLLNHLARAQVNLVEKQFVHAHAELGLFDSLITSNTPDHFDVVNMLLEKEVIMQNIRILT